MMPVKEGSRTRGNERKQDSVGFMGRRIGRKGGCGRRVVLMKKGKGEGEM